MPSGDQILLRNEDIGREIYLIYRIFIDREDQGEHIERGLVGVLDGHAVLVKRPIGAAADCSEIRQLYSEGDLLPLVGYANDQTPIIGYYSSVVWLRSECKTPYDRLSSVLHTSPGHQYRILDRELRKHGL